MILGLDYRPALLSPTGISRVVRELTARLAAQEGISKVRLLGHSLAAAAHRPPTLPPGTTLHRLPLPGRLLPALARLGLGAERLIGGCDLFLWTDYVFPPVRGARRAMLLHDLAFMVRPAWHGDQAGVLTERVRAVATEADRILVPSPLVLEDVKRHLPGVAERTRVVPWGGDHATELAAPDRVPDHLRSRPDRGPLLVAVGRVEPRKGHHLLLEAFGAVRRDHPGSRLVVAGPPGWAAPELIDRLRALHADPDSGVRWERGLDDGALLGLVAQADLLLYPSEYEGFGLPVLEALALGVTPVVRAGTTCAWVAGEAGVLFDEPTPESLAGAVLDRLASPPPGAAARRINRTRAGTFTWARSAARLAEEVT